MEWVQPDISFFGEKCTFNLLTPFLLSGASPIKQLGSRYSSSRHLPEAAPAITSTRLSNHDAISWKFQQAPETRCGYFSLLRLSIRPLGSPDYFLDVFLFSAQLFPIHRNGQAFTASIYAQTHSAVSRGGDKLRVLSN